MKKLILTLTLGCSALFAGAAPSILTLKQSITDDAIVYPESFETDTHKMMQNWYLAETIIPYLTTISPRCRQSTLPMRYI